MVSAIASRRATMERESMPWARVRWAQTERQRDVPAGMRRILVCTHVTRVYVFSWSVGGRGTCLAGQVARSLRCMGRDEGRRCA